MNKQALIDRLHEFLENEACSCSMDFECVTPNVTGTRKPKDTIMTTRKILLAIMAMLLPLLAMAENVEINGIYYSVIAKSQTAKVIAKPSGIGNSGTGSCFMKNRSF